MHEGLSAATLFAVRGSEYRGVACRKVFRGAGVVNVEVEGLSATRLFTLRNRLLPGLPASVNVWGRVSGFRMALNRTGM